MSDPTGMTTPTAVPPTPDLAGLENLQEGVTKLLLGNGGNVPGAFLLFSHLHGSMIKPKTIPHLYTDIRCSVFSAKNRQHIQEPENGQ